MFIVIEGTDAAGKHTQTGLLAEKVHNNGHGPVVTQFSFPQYETKIGQLILKSLKKEGEVTVDDHLNLQCLMFMDKIDAATEIDRRDRDEEYVIADRWWQSGVVYGSADGLQPAWLCHLSGVLPKADLNILIDVPPEMALERRPEARDRYERDRNKQKLVYTNYHFLWSSMKATDERDSWIIIDGRGSIEKVATEIYNAVVYRRGKL